MLGLAAVAACEGSDDAAAVRNRPGSPTPSATREEPGAVQKRSSRRTVRPPRPRHRLSDAPRRLAEELAGVHKQLRSEIRGWLNEGGKLSGSRVRSITLHALKQQRIYRKLARDLPLARKVVRFLRGPLTETARANILAGHKLAELVTPVKPPVRLKTSRPESPHSLKRFHRSAGRRFGLPWQVLAAVNFVETRFGRILGPSSSGALGPMQFLPSTWARYSNGGDIIDPRDSIMAAGRYLSASGAPERMRDALFAYNRSDAYVEAILLYAKEIRKDPSNFYSYYFWQVFVATTQGDVQLTGPGSRRRLE